jgi:iron complex outermembrane receptor protein
MSRFRLRLTALQYRSTDFLALALLATSGPTLGQENVRGNLLLEEVIVTAQKREESIQDVGIAITAFTGGQIKQLSFETSIDIISMTPGVSTGGDIGGQRSLFMIRGVVQNDFADFVEAPISVYVDEAYLASTQGQTFALFDVERVEILKGPQGTLFGRNATGGLVHFITRKPTFEREGYLDLEGGEYGHFRAEGAASQGITDTLAIRLSGLYDRHDEIFDNKYPFGAPGATIFPWGQTGPGNPFGEDTWNDDTWAFRGQLLWEPNEDLEVLVSDHVSQVDKSEGPYQTAATTQIVNASGGTVDTIFTPKSGPLSTCEALPTGGAPATAQGCLDHTQRLAPVGGQPVGLPLLPTVGVDGEIFIGDGTAANFPDFDVSTVPPFSFPLGAAPEDGLRPVPGGDLFGYVDPDGEDFDTSKDFALEDINEFDTYGVTGKIAWQMDETTTITSITNYSNYKRLVVLDVDSAPVPQTLFQSESEIESISEELRYNGNEERYRYVLGL